MFDQTDIVRRSVVCHDEGKWPHNERSIPLAVEHRRTTFLSQVANTPFIPFRIEDTT